MQILYLAELIFTVSAIITGLHVHVRRMAGWQQVPILLPWLFIKAGLAIVMLVGTVRHPYVGTWVLLIAGPATITVLFAMRIATWKRG